MPFRLTPSRSRKGITLRIYHEVEPHQLTLLTHGRRKRRQAPKRQPVPHLVASLELTAEQAAELADQMVDLLARQPPPARAVRYSLAPEPR